MSEKQKPTPQQTDKALHETLDQKIPLLDTVEPAWSFRDSN